MPYSSADIITWAKATQALAARNEPKLSALTGMSITPRLDHILRIERTSLEWQLSQDPTDEDELLFPIGNYVLSLIGMYLSEAQIDSGVGGGLVVDPTTPSSSVSSSIFPLFKTASDFEPDGVSYNDPDIVGKNLMIKVLGFTQDQQFAPAFFSYTATGIQITFPGFDINNYEGVIIEQYNP